MNYIYGTIPWVSPLQLLPNDPFFSAPGNSRRGPGMRRNWSKQHMPQLVAPAV